MNGSHSYVYVAMQARELVFNNTAPDWVHLLPAGQIQTHDNRGPYQAKDLSGIIAATFEQADRIPVDENHALELAAPKGQASPARGWIVEMAVREDGIWGRVEWTETGRKLVEAREYRGLSPVVVYTEDTQQEITGIKNVALVNYPNLRGLTALHNTEKDGVLEKLLEELAKALGLEDPTEASVVEAVTKMMAQKKDPKDTSSEGDAVAMQSVASHLGLEGHMDLKSVMSAIDALKGDNLPGGTVSAMQSALTDAQKEIATLKEGSARTAAEGFVDQAIKDGAVGVMPERETYIVMHMESPERTERLVGGLPKVTGNSVSRQMSDRAPPKDGQAIALQAHETDVAKMLGISQKDMAATLSAELKGDV